MQIRLVSCLRSGYGYITDTRSTIITANAKLSRALHDAGITNARSTTTIASTTTTNTHTKTTTINHGSLQPLPHYSHPFSTQSHLSKKTDQLPPRPTLPDSDLKHSYLKGSGPGGQKINKTSSAVQLTHLPTGIVVKSQATRSRSQNHTIAKRILAEKIEFLERGDESRVAKKIERVRRKKASGEKKRRRKYRRLEEGGLNGGGGGDHDGLGSGVNGVNGVGGVGGGGKLVDGNGVDDTRHEYRAKSQR